MSQVKNMGLAFIEDDLQFKTISIKDRKNVNILWNKFLVAAYFLSSDNFKFILSKCRMVLTSYGWDDTFLRYSRRNILFTYIY